jgi:hypothetical protein
MAQEGAQQPRSGDLAGGHWRKSTYSAYNGNCVEVRLRPGQVAVRDSKAVPGAAELRFTPAAWSAFMRGLKRRDLA